MKTWLRAVRIHQAAKNLLLLLPPAFAHQFSDARVWRQALLGALAFCLASCGMYVMNDLLDLESDRAHHQKKHRPFASGALPMRAGLWLAPLLLAASAIPLWWLPRVFAGALGAYVALTAAYSWFLKSVPLVDALVLAGLYTIRILAGGAATGVFISQWLLAFSVFFFFSLALLKRLAELKELEQQNRMRILGRGYSTQDLDQLATFGASSGYLSVLVLALYVHSPEVRVLYSKPNLLWLICPLLLYWISRMWLLAHRRQMDEDPVIFALKDKTSYLVGLAAVAIMRLAF